MLDDAAIERATRILDGVEPLPVRPEGAEHKLDEHIRAATFPCNVN